MGLSPASRLTVAATAATLVALALAAATAQAAPSCSRGGGTVLAASAHVRVISIANRPRNQETRRDHIFGCRMTTGRRFEMFFSRSFGLDLIHTRGFNSRLYWIVVVAAVEQVKSLDLGF
jgi:hypothetical protein